MPSLNELVKQGEGAQDAVDVGNGIFMSRNIANSYLVTTPDGDLLVNTGTDFEAEEIKSRFARASKGPLRVITLPPELALPQVHGKVPWIVRSIWEEHVGWFRYESTTELYDVPPSSVWPDVVEVAGGTGPLVERADAPGKAGR